jgi:hypothetical protein
MKPILLATIVLIALSSCNTPKEYIQIFNTSTTDAQFQNQKEQWIYETDSVRIKYDFWAEKGEFSFNIYNKLDVPLFIDWKNSAFIHSDTILSYWSSDQRISTSSKVYTIKLPVVDVTRGNETSVMSKQDRISILPPKASLSKREYLIMPVSNFSLQKEITGSVTVPRNDNQAKETTVYFKEYTNADSPLIFRNYLNLSLSENFENNFNIDNAFYISKVSEMALGHFRGKSISTADGSIDYEKPMKNESSFYLRVDFFNHVGK